MARLVTDYSPSLTQELHTNNDKVKTTQAKSEKPPYHATENQKGFCRAGHWIH